MLLKPIKDAFESIKERSRIVSGKRYPIFDVFLGFNPVTQKPTRLYASSREKLEEKVREFYKKHKMMGDFASLLDTKQLMDARMAIELIYNSKQDLTLTECVKRTLKEIGDTICADISLMDASIEYRKTKRYNSEAEISKVESVLGCFINAIGGDKWVGTITCDDIKKYLDTFYNDKAPRTYNSILLYLRTFFKWCMKPSQKYLTKDPTEAIEKRVVTWRKPKYLHPSYVEKLFRLLEHPQVVKEFPQYLALAVTQFFVGVRRAEAIRIATDTDAATILIEDETFRVDKGKGYTRGRAPRTAHLEDNAVEWMKSFDYLNALNMIDESTTRNLYRFAKANGIPMFQNCMRHTFITMHVAKYHTPEVTQTMVGTSGHMRAEHYDGLAPQKEGEMFFNIYPTVRE